LTTSRGGLRRKLRSIGANVRRAQRRRVLVHGAEVSYPGEGPLPDWMEIEEDKS
jgi:hypothetical protein